MCVCESQEDDTQVEGGGGANEFVLPKKKKKKSGDSHEFTNKLISSISTRLSDPKSVVAISFYEKNSCNTIKC